MTDKELLELAAKAAGIAFIKYKDVDGVWREPDDPSGELSWNPLTDDGDALRLAVKLKLYVAIRDDDSRANANRVNKKLREMHGIDPYAATRRAIVRAAAEIGKYMS